MVLKYFALEFIGGKIINFPFLSFVCFLFLFYFFLDHGRLTTIHDKYLKYNFKAEINAFVNSEDIKTML